MFFFISYSAKNVSWQQLVSFSLHPLRGRVHRTEGHEGRACDRKCLTKLRCSPAEITVFSQVGGEKVKHKASIDPVMLSVDIHH